MSDRGDQRQKILTEQGHLLVLGGPGSGKTTIALRKAKTEIESGNLKRGQKILFLSFARSTLSRVTEQSLGEFNNESRKLIELSTYHGFAWNVLRSHGYLLGKARQLRVFLPHDAASYLADIPGDKRKQELKRLFQEDGLIHFDLFAGLTADLFMRSTALCKVFSNAFPLIIVDEFQDTDAAEWGLVKALGTGSRLIALADPDQRIYEFRGADPMRIKEFSDEFSPVSFDFGTENHRSANTDIVTFANDLLTGKNKGKTYENVKALTYGFYQGKHELFSAKACLLQCLKRARKAKGPGDVSVAVLVPSNRLMLQLSDYLSKAMDDLPVVPHTVAFDAEGPALAASIIALLLEINSSDESNEQRLVQGIATHIRGRSGSKGPSKANGDLARALLDHVSGKKITGSKRLAVIESCRQILKKRLELQLTGDPGKDWLLVRQLLTDSASESVKQVADDAKYLRLFRRGALLQARLSEVWRESGIYQGALNAVNDALLQEHFAAASHEVKGVYVMTIHKSKGKEFDEVLIYEGRYTPIVRANSSSAQLAQSRLSLRVAVTRGRMNSTILMPKSSPCPLL
jgi:DNA helicase II / ATP-dependent DNA helicase PcrA